MEKVFYSYFYYHILITITKCRSKGIDRVCRRGSRIIYDFLVIKQNMNIIYTSICNRNVLKLAPTYSVPQEVPLVFQEDAVHFPTIFSTMYI